MKCPVCSKEMGKRRVTPKHKNPFTGQWCSAGLATIKSGKPERSKASPKLDLKLQSRG